MKEIECRPFQTWNEAFTKEPTFRMKEVQFYRNSSNPELHRVIRVYGTVTTYAEQRYAGEIVPLPTVHIICWNYLGKATEKGKRASLFDIKFGPIK